MKVWNATEDQIRAAADIVGLKLAEDWNGGGVSKDGRALRFRLAVDTARHRDEGGFLPYQRCSTWRGGKDGTPRKVAAVCWHGHRDFMRALFETAPEARLKTALADYRGADDFEAKFLGTRGTGNGWNVSYEQACGCSTAIRRAA